MKTDFAMFTKEGNVMIAGIVKTAIRCRFTWPEVLDVLEAASQNEGFGEAMDTAVREEVYDVCGFTSTFYV